MSYTTTERQIIHLRRGVKRSLGTDTEELSREMLGRMEQRYEAEGNVVADLGKAQFNEAWRQIIEGEVKWVQVYAPRLDEEIVISRFGAMNWQDKTNVYSMDEIKLMKGMDSQMLEMVHLVKSGIPGVEVVEFSG